MARPRPAEGEHTERDGDQNPGRQRQRHEQDVLSRAHAQARDPARLLDGHVQCQARREEIRGDGTLRFSPDLDPRVQGANPLGIEPPGQAREGGNRGGGALLEFSAVEIERLVLGEVALIVDQDREAIVGDLGIGGVEVHDVDFAGGERAVGKIMIETADIGLRKIVALFQTWPTVAAMQELVGQADAQMRMGA